MHRFANPARFLRIARPLTPALFWLGLILTLAACIWGLFFTPTELLMGDTVKIIFVHVPAAWLGMGGWTGIAIASIVQLVWRHPLAGVSARAIAVPGATFAAICLITGSIWGRPTWGTWWVWDARLTSTLLLFFLFVGVIALRSAMDNRDSAGRAAAVLALVGVVNLPIIKYSVDWLFTLHQSSSFSLTEKPAMPPEMWLPLLIMVLGFYLFFFVAWMLRIRVEILNREIRTQWVRDKLTGARD